MASFDIRLTKGLVVCKRTFCPSSRTRLPLNKAGACVVGCSVRWSAHGAETKRSAIDLEEIGGTFPGLDAEHCALAASSRRTGRLEPPDRIEPPIGTPPNSRPNLLPWST